MSDVYYYVKKPEPQVDSSWLAALSNGLAAAIQAAGPGPFADFVLDFSVGAIISSSAGVATENISLTVKYVDESSVQIGDDLYPIDVLLESVATTTITEAIVGLAIASFGIPTSSVVIIGIASVATATAVGYAYSWLVDPAVEEALDILQGGVDVNMELIDANGNVIAGALYKDGLASGETPLEVKNILENDLGLPLPTKDMIIRFHQEGEVIDQYKFYDENIITNAADIFLGGDTSSFVSFSNNEAHMTEVLIDGEVKRWVYARTIKNGQSVDIETDANEQIVIPVSGLNLAFNPYNIYVANDGVINSTANDIYDRLYLGDFENSLGNKKFEDNNGDGWLFGGGGDDELHGHLGDDHLFGDFGGVESNNAYAASFSGNDLLYGGGGNDTLYGGLGDDILDGGDDIDVLYGEGGNDILRGGTFMDTLDGGTNDTYSTSEQQSGISRINEGPSGFKGDTVDYSQIDSDYNVEVNLNLAQGMGDVRLSGSPIISSDTLINIENVFGHSGDDIFVGNDQSNVFVGNGGNDVMVGNGGADFYYIDIPENANGGTFVEGDAADFAYIEGRASDYYDIKEMPNNVWQLQHKETLGTINFRGMLLNHIIFEDGTIIVDTDTDISAGIHIDNSVVRTVDVRGPRLVDGSPDPAAGRPWLDNIQRTVNPEDGSIETTFDMYDSTGFICGTTMRTHTGDFWTNGGISPDDPYAPEGIVSVYYNDKPVFVIGQNGHIYDVTAFGELDGYVPVDAADLIYDVEGYSQNLVGGADAVFGTADELYDFLNMEKIIVHEEIRVAEEDFGIAKNSASPLVLDLDGDGIELTSLEDSNVFWDIDQDGFAENVGWVKPDDGLLAIDLDGDGQILYHSELFGSSTQDGFTDLTTLDSNFDGVIDANDAQFGDLLVWLDINQNGISGESELFSLNDLNITQIDLNANTPYNLYNQGHNISHTSTFTIDDGVNGPITQDIVDVWFNFDNVNTLYKQDFVYDLNTFVLPTLRGYGTLPGLRIAASIDNDYADPDSLIRLLHDFSYRGLDGYYADNHSIMEDTQAILFRWAGVEAIDPASRGDYLDARKLEFLEKMFDKEFLQGGWLADPGVGAAAYLDKSFEQAHYLIAGRLLAQVLAKDLFEGDVTYNQASDSFDGFAGFKQSGLDALLAKSLDGAQVTDKMTFWLDVVNSIDASVGLSNISASDLAVLESTLQASDLSLSINDLIDKRDLNIETKLYWLPEGVGLYGTTGDDILTGGVGDDYFNGQLGNDTIYGGIGDDIFYGGGGNDVFYGQLGNDTMWGQTGSDTYHYTLGHGDDDIVEQGHDVDRIVFSNELTVDDILIYRTPGTSLYLQVDPNIGGGSITVGWGYLELLEFSDGTILDVRTMDLVTHGTSGDDTLYGTRFGQEGSGVDTIYGYDGNDTIYGRSPNQSEYNPNYMDGGNGDDKLYGAFGNDTYVMGLGNDQAVENGRGDDTFIYTGGLDEVWEYTSVASQDTLILDVDKTINDIEFSRSGNDALVVVDSGENEVLLHNVLYNWRYNIETVEFGDGFSTDLLSFESWQYGTDDFDTLNGTNLADTIIGKMGNDLIYGLDGDDDIHGGGDNDILFGGNGYDKLWGGTGADTFVFEGDSAFDNVDIVGDFNLAEDDVLDLSDILSGYDPLSDAIIDFIEITDNGTDSILSVDADGGGDNFVQVATLLNVTGLTDEQVLEASGNLVTV